MLHAEDGTPSRAMTIITPSDQLLFSQLGVKAFPDLIGVWDAAHVGQAAADVHEQAVALSLRQQLVVSAFAGFDVVCQGGADELGSPGSGHGIEQSFDTRV